MVIQTAICKSANRSKPVDLLAKIGKKTSRTKTLDASVWETDASKLNSRCDSGPLVDGRISRGMFLGSNKRHFSASDFATAGRSIASRPLDCFREVLQILLFLASSALFKSAFRLKVIFPSESVRFTRTKRLILRRNRYHFSPAT